MNFFDYLANPLAIIDKDSKWTPNMSKLTDGNMFKRGADETGAGKPAVQSFVRNFSDALLGSKTNDYLNTRMLQDAPAQTGQPQPMQPAALEYGPNQDPMQQMISQWMKLGGTR